MTHALGLAIHQRALRVGRAEDVCARTCHINDDEFYITQSQCCFSIKNPLKMHDRHLLSHFAPWLGSGQTQNFPELQKALPGQSLLRWQVFTLMHALGLDGSGTESAGQPHLNDPGRFWQEMPKPQVLTLRHSSMSTQRTRGLPV